jgi:hypothetical protein
MKPYKLSLVLLLVLLATTLFAKPPIKFGKVSEEELKMSVYSPDSSAAAVVLCDYGVFSLQDYHFTRTVRIKILKKEGLYLANDVYPGVEKTDIRGKTYNLVEGEIEVSKLKNESVFSEKVHEDYYNLRIAMPDVKVGSVFEIEIKHGWFPTVWAFQREIPVKWSELIMPQSMYFDVQRRFTGFESLHYTSSDHWVAKDMPAFKPEPYINASVNYITKFDIDLEEIAVPGIYYKEYATDWNAVARRLDESTWFGGHFNKAFYLNNIAKEIETNYTEDIDKVQAAYAAIKKVKWNEQKALYASKSTSLGSIYEDGVGNSADINIMLINLLKKLGLKAHPVILSTRDNGVISPYYPSSSRLNYVIAYLKIGAEDIFLDATDEDLPMGMLPRRCLNGIGQTVNDKYAQAVKLTPKEKEKSTQMLTLQLGEDLSLQGTYMAKHQDYSAYDIRKEIKEYNSQESYIEDRENKYSGLSIDNYTIKNLDEIEKPVSESCEVTLENMAFELEDKIYLNPLLHLQMKDNPFKTEERKYPVDFTVARSYMNSISISLPEGYTVVEVPAPVRMGLPDNAATVMYNVHVLGNQIKVIYKLDINKPVFYTGDYVMLREFYSQIIKKHAEPIIISKS